MKHITQLISGLLVVVLLCCACSAGNGGLSGPKTVTAIPLAEQDAPVGFTDVPSGAWYAEAAEWCRENGVVSGTTDTTFSPDETMTHAMLLTILYRAAGSPSVSSTGDAWYSEAIAWSAGKGLTRDYDNGQLDPDMAVTREQIAAILWRYTDSHASGTAEDYADETTISPFAQTAVDWAKASGIMSGVGDNRFEPSGTTTRAQTVMVLYRYLSGGANSGISQGKDSDVPIVYMTTDISSDSLMAIYKELSWTPGNKVAVKLSTGEPGSNYLRTDLIGPLVQSMPDPTIVECNTAYGGSRANTVMHYQVAEDHGYTAIADVDIMDENGSMTLPVVDGENLTENYVGANFANYVSFLILSHFKGHSMAGFGGAIKNISIGIASSQGKSHIHSGGAGGSMWGGDQDAFLESMAEAGKSVVEALDGRIVYINVMNRLSVDCDCDGSPAEPDMHDIGILASYDPVALDQACVDWVYAAEDGNSLINRIESRNGLHTLEHAEKIGLGSREYQLVRIDQDKQ